MPEIIRIRRNVRHCECYPQSFSDHCIAEMLNCIPDIMRIEKPFISRSSYWKMNVDTIVEDFLENLTEIYSKARTHLDEYDDKADW